MNDRITYLLGAGASAQAVPTVEAFKERIRIFCNYIDFLSLERNLLNKNTANFYRGEYNWLISGIDDHMSPDYFAKFLGQTSNDSSNRVKLIKLKLLLSLFLICEQTQKTLFDEFIQYMDNRTLPNERIPRQVRNSIDPRYRVFWQDIFVEGGSRLLPNYLNIITWNYDSQLELSLMEFSKKTLSEINNELQIIPNINNEKINRHKLSIVKLNGSAGVFYKKENNQVLDGISYFDSTSLEWLRIFELFRDQISIASQLIEHPNFYFSWEDDIHPKRARSLAKEILNKTNKLVIIGYSLPDYNKVIDSELLHNAMDINEIVIQAQKNDEIGIIKRFKKRFENRDINIEFEPNVDKFFTF